MSFDRKYLKSSFISFKSWKDKVSKKEDKEEEPEPVKSKASKKFKDAYKYDIVKDYIDAQEKSIYKEASKELRKPAE